MYFYIDILGSTATIKSLWALGTQIIIDYVFETKSKMRLKFRNPLVIAVTSKPTDLYDKTCASLCLGGCADFQRISSGIT